MLRRLLVGLVLGAAVGGALAAAVVEGLKTTTFAGSGGLVLAYVVAAIAGVLTGLVAGKPIWAAGAKVEAGLKAVFGALLGAGAMFALRQWANGWVLDLSSFGAGGPAPLGDLPAVSLPVIAAVLGGFFELDNTGSDGNEPGVRKRIVGASTAARVVDAGQEDEIDADRGEAVSKRAKR